MGWTFYDSSGRKLNTASTLIDNLDIDGATDIGAAIADADLFIIDDGAGGTNRKTAASRIKTYLGLPDGAVKAYARINGAGTLYPNGLNIASVTDTATGNLSVVFDTDFANTDYIAVAIGAEIQTETSVEFGTFATGSVNQRRFNPNGGALVDYATGSAFFGDH